jgi:hypothetical protein
MKAYKSFDNALIKANEIIKESNHTSDDARNDIELKVLDENLLIETFEDLLKIDYIPPPNLILIQNHLCALWIFYKALPTLSPKPFPLSLVMRLDLAFIKLTGKVCMVIHALHEDGIKFDYNLWRTKAGINKRSDIWQNTDREQYIIGAYKKVYASYKSKDSLSKDIKKELGTNWQTPPSKDTIKRVLKKAKLSPWD